MSQVIVKWAPNTAEVMEQDGGTFYDVTVEEVDGLYFLRDGNDDICAQFGAHDVSVIVINR
jgi:hypothetical protein